MKNNPFLSRMVLGKTITVASFYIGNDLHISIFGGDAPHIGAVAIVSPDKSINNLVILNHKEGVITQLWAERLAAENLNTVVIEAGIHYDGLSKAGISAVINSVNEMLEEFISSLKS